jgi:hypothetical protein
VSLLRMHWANPHSPTAIFVGHWPARNRRTPGCDAAVGGHRLPGIGHPPLEVTLNLYHTIGIVTAREWSTITDLVVIHPKGKEEMLPLLVVVDLIRRGDVFYTEVGGSRTPIYVVSGPVRGTFVRTPPNASTADNLLSLPRYRVGR